MIKVTDIQDKLQRVRNEGGFPTLSTGSVQLDKHLRLVVGFPWFLGGQPHHGKTEVTMELLLKWSKLYGWKHYCYFGESGEIENIVADLCYKLIGKPYFAGSSYSMNESERMYAEQFVSEHFYFADPDKDYTWELWMKEITEAERTLRVKFNTTCFDPFNDLDYDMAKYPNITYWLKDVLKDVKRSSKINNRIDMLIVHIGETAPVKDSDGNYYTPAALPTQWEGGKIWNRRAFVQINIWKNLQGQTELIVNKAKPKEAKVYDAEYKAHWRWDWKKNRYDENVGGEQKCILEDEPTKVQEYNTRIEPKDDVPF